MRLEVVMPYLTGIGPDQSLRIFGIRLVGITAQTGRKLLLTLTVLLLLYLLGRGLERVTRAGFAGEKQVHIRFWWRQGIRLATMLVGTVLLISIWFDDPRRLTTVFGLLSAGVAIALQRLITAFAAYFVILRGQISPSSGRSSTFQFPTPLIGPGPNRFFCSPRNGAGYGKSKTR